MKIGGKLAVAQGLLLLALGASFALGVSSQLGERLLARSDKVQAQRLEDALNMLDAYNQALKGSVDQFARMFEAELIGQFTLDTQQTLATGPARTGVLRLDNTVLNNRVDEVDRFTARTSAVATVFVRHGEQLIRVSTSLRHTNGERALGTALDAGSPAYQSLMAGLPYIGKSQLFSRDYMARYTPLENAQGEVIGAIFVGVDITQDIVNLKARLAKVRVGDSGQLHVLALDGPQRGQFVLHPSLNGKNALALRDHHDQPVYAPMLDAPQGARRVTPAGTSSPHLLRYAAYQDWRWLLISDELHDEINAENQLILFWLLVGLGVLLVLLVAAMALSSRRLVSQPLGALASQVNDISQQRDLTRRLPAQRRDEMGALALAFNRLLDAFQQALRTTLDSAQQVDDAARGVSDSAHRVAQDSQQQSLAAQHISQEIDLLNQGIAEIADDTRQAQQLTAQSAAQAQRSQQDVAHAIEEVSQVADTLSTAPSTLSSAQQQVEQISAIVSVIDPVRGKPRRSAGKDSADGVAVLAVDGGGL